MESKFKVGDKVRFNSEWGSYRFEDSLTKGEVVEISDITDYGSIYVKKYVEAQVTDDEIELVEQDKKTAFLTELKELMEKYDAVIAWSSQFGFDKQCDMCFIRPKIAFKFDKDIVSYTHDNIYDTNLLNGVITPSNIFDYDK